MSQVYEIKKGMKKARVRSLFGTVGTILVLAAMILFLGIHAVSFYHVRGTGMTPSIANGAVVMVNRLAYQFNTPRRGDVVIANGHLLRVIGLPGERITFHGGEIFIDGNRALESYLTEPGTYPCGTNDSFFLGKEDYFLLSDNRDCYDDSRSGTVYSSGTISGRVLYLFQ